MRSSGCSRERAVSIDEPRDASALWRWRDGANPVVTAVSAG